MVDFWRRRVGNYGCLLSSSSRYLKLAVRREFNVICSFFLQNLTQFSIFFFFFDIRCWWPKTGNHKSATRLKGRNALTSEQEVYWFGSQWKLMVLSANQRRAGLEAPVAACCYRISWAKLFFSHLTCDSYCGIGQRWKWAWLDPTCHWQLPFFSSLQMGVITTGLTLSPLNTFPFLRSRSSTQKLP